MEGRRLILTQVVFGAGEDRMATDGDNAWVRVGKLERV